MPQPGKRRRRRARVPRPPLLLLAVLLLATPPPPRPFALAADDTDLTVCATGADWDYVTSLTFDEIRDAPGNIVVGVCDVVFLRGTSQQQRCRYDATHPRNRPRDAMLLRGQPSGTDYQVWYAYQAPGYAYLDCVSPDLKFDVRVRVLRRAEVAAAKRAARAAAAAGRAAPCLNC